MLKPLMLVLALTLWPAATLPAQASGDYPHLVLVDDLGGQVPGPSGPFDNTGVFEAVSGQSFTARVTYQSPGQPNNNVAWALLVSALKTPLPLDTVPPPLLTAPPFLLVVPSPPTLSVAGVAELPLFVPPGVLTPALYVQALVYDVTSSPAMRLANGLKVEVELPQLSVNFSFVRSKPGGGDGQLMDLGVIDIDGDTLKTLKPVGTEAPPEAIPDPSPLLDDFRFLPILSNLGDEPVNPLARPVTRIAGSVTATATEIPVTDTRGFPTRGRLMISFGNSNLWTVKNQVTTAPPAVEVVSYDGTTPTSFLNCVRQGLGSKGSTVAAGYAHVNNELVLGFFTMATTSGARLRTRVSLDADNRDMPHVVIPPFTFDAGGDEGTVTRDLDLYLYETLTEKIQGFMLLDRVTGTWRAIPGTERNVAQGRWNPMITLAPDRRSMIAHLQVPGGVFGWDNAPDGLLAVRLDGLHWPATSAETWPITYQVEADPALSTVSTVRSRRVWMPATAIIGTDPDNYVAYIGLAHKWRQSTPAPGANSVVDQGWEAEYAHEELIVRDYIECPLIGPESGKGLPVMPRPWMTAAFGNTAEGSAVKRFDPDVLRLANDSQLMLTTGSTEVREEVFVIRNVSVAQSGVVNRSLVNISGYTNQQAIGQELLVRAYKPGGHGWGRKAAASPNSQRVAFLLRDRKGSGNLARKEWLQIALTNGGSFSKLKNIYAGTEDPIKGDFKIVGSPLKDERTIMGLRFIDNTRLVFMMGLLRYDDPLTTGANVPATDLFLYDITADMMTNLTKTGGPNGTGFLALGRINPGGYFASDDGEFLYILRAGGITDEAFQFSTNPALILPKGTAVANILGLNTLTLDTFPVSGTELDASASIGNLTLATGELDAPVETAGVMGFVEGDGVQQGLMYFRAHRVGGNAADDVFAVDRDQPFVAFAATAAAAAGSHVSNIVPDPYGGKLAFARTASSDAFSVTQHPFVVDLDNFLFERDLAAPYKLGGVPLGRVMDGSFHFIPPEGSASDALVFSFGLVSLNGGIPGLATPAYYSLATVSDLLAEPTAVLIPLVDTVLLGTDYRFYVPRAGPSEN